MTPMDRGVLCFSSFDKTYVIDSDTFSWNGQTYRLWGIDAPEQKQSCRWPEDYKCGALARSYLRSLIDPATLACEIKPRAKKEMRIVAETDVRTARRRLWAGEFQQPQAWRKANPR